MIIINIHHHRHHYHHQSFEILCMTGVSQSSTVFCLCCSIPNNAGYFFFIISSPCYLSSLFPLPSIVHCYFLCPSAFFLSGYMRSLFPLQYFNSMSPVTMVCCRIHSFVFLSCLLIFSIVISIALCVTRLLTFDAIL